MHFVPTMNNVVVRLDKTSATTKSGIHIPTAYQNDKPSIAYVVAVGPQVTGIPPESRVAYRTTKNLTVVKDDQDTTFILMEDKDILAIVED